LILFPFLSAIGNAAGVIIDKIILAKKKVPLGFFQTFLFLFLCFFFLFINSSSHPFARPKELTI